MGDPACTDFGATIFASAALATLQHDATNTTSHPSNAITIALVMPLLSLLGVLLFELFELDKDHLLSVCDMNRSITDPVELPYGSH